MTQTRLALIGMGRMGRAIDDLAESHDCTVVARHGSDEVARHSLTAASLANADVAIEFTVPAAALSNVEQCLQAGTPIVIGTTGWQHELDRLHEMVRVHEGRVLWSPNFAPGVQLMLALAEAAGTLFRQALGFDAHLVETHHAAKLDAPSGTAIAIRDSVEHTLGRVVPVTSVRVGSVPGTHELTLDAPFEQLRITHEARDRRVFADGALAAARWLAADRAPGVYTMRDVLGLTINTDTVS